MLRNRFVVFTAVLGAALLGATVQSFGYIRQNFTDAGGAAPYNRPDATAIQY